jgi:hypothetical protein
MHSLESAAADHPQFGHHCAIDGVAPASMIRRELEAMARMHPIVLAGVALLGWSAAVSAQTLSQPPGSIPGAGPAGPSPVCQRLEAQLAAVDRGGLDPTRAAQVRRYEDALQKQQGELDRVTSQSRRLGCSGGGFFSLFVGQPPECNALSRQIKQMHANIDRMTMELQRLQGGTTDREYERRSVLAALSRNDCGPQYRSAGAQQPRNIFEALFGPGTIVSPGQSDVFQSSTYRTLCVRTCDGYYFPISFSTVPNRFPDDERTCQRMCPAAEAVLFTHRNPGEDISQAASLSGRLYSELPNAFEYRKAFNPACSCRRAGETWAGALGHTDDTIERGDIVVTDERAKQLSQPRDARSAPRSAAGKPEQPAARPQANERPALRNGTATGENKVRSVGPTFLPRQ